MPELQVLPEEFQIVSHMQKVITTPSA